MVVFELFFNSGVGHFGTFLVVFEYFRVRGIRVSLIGTPVAFSGAFWRLPKIALRCPNR